MPESPTLRLTVAIAAMLATMACDLLNPTDKPDPTPPPPVIKTYPAMKINARWSGGRTGSPSNLEAVEGTHGGFCPASSLLLENHSARFKNLFSWSEQVLVIYNNCTAAASLLVCSTYGGGGSSSEFPSCDKDPSTTPLSRMDIVELGPANNSLQSATWRTTGPALDIFIFYCNPGDPFALNIIPGAKPTDCMQ